jgi:hypothetical protein
VRAFARQCLGTFPTVLTVLTVLTAPTVPTVPTFQQRGRLSEEASVSQTVDGTRISVEYFRPRARGRDPLFGKVVHWNETWTPGANWATTLEVNKDIKLDGHALAKGRYSVWMVPRQAGNWTLVLDPRHRRWHTSRPDSTAEQLRMPVKRDAGSFTEALTWSFPEVRMDGTVLTLQWGTTRVAVNVEVQPSYQLTVPAAIAEAYVGSYRYMWKDEAADSAKAQVLIVTHENGSLMARFEPADEYWNPIMLIPIADHWFIPGVFSKGKLYEMEKEIVFEFAVTAGRAGEITVRDEGDGVIATATRKS